MKILTALENMKRSQEKHAVENKVTAIQRRVMEVTHRLQLVQDEVCTLFEEIEGQGSHLEQVVAIVEQHLEGPIIEQVIQEFTK
jgi:hypothetical protein